MYLRCWRWETVAEALATETLHVGTYKWDSIAEDLQLETTCRAIQWTTLDTMCKSI